MPSKYRHRSIAGSTRHSLRSFYRHFHKIGTPRYVRGVFAGKPYPWYSVIIRGTRGSLLLRGCGWGYSGEGPRGTEEVLTKLGCHPFDVQRCAFEAPNKDVPKSGVKEVWRLVLSSSGLPQTNEQTFKKS